MLGSFLLFFFPMAQVTHLLEANSLLCGPCTSTTQLLRASLTLLLEMQEPE